MIKMLIIALVLVFFPVHVCGNITHGEQSIIEQKETKPKAPEKKKLFKSPKKIRKPNNIDTFWCGDVVYRG